MNQRAMASTVQGPKPPAGARMLQRKCACGNHASGGSCSACAAKRQASSRQAITGAEETGVPGLVRDVLESSGQPLEPGARTLMEQRFGQDFSRVRVHADARAAASAGAVQAHAYTVGDHIVFGSAQYAPGTERGTRLLAHELTHVVQQGVGGGAGPHFAKAVSHPSDASEIEADRVAEQVMSGAGPVQVAQPAGAVIQGLSIGEGIGIGIGVAAGATLVGLGIAALAGAFGRRRWSITQANTDGPEYASDVSITFNPDASANCTEIAFVQAVRLGDTGSGALFENRPNFLNRRTAAGWTVDRLDAKQYGWYGYNNDGSPSGTVSPGNSPPPRAATMTDRPGYSRPNSSFQFEVCAICRAGTDANQVYGCYTWGFTVDGSNHLTSLPNQETAGASAEFSESIRQWNAQAAGPAAQRNNPSQATLGPLR